MLKRVFHIAVNVTDLDRSVAFYQRLGFQVLADRTVSNEKLSEAFVVLEQEVPVRAPAPRRRRAGDPARRRRVVRPADRRRPGESRPRTRPGSPGSPCSPTTPTAVYRELSADGVEFLTEPTSVMTPEGGWKVCLAVDPDGVVVQVTELLPRTREA